MNAENHVSEFQTCPQCHAQMLREMRFCRQCGLRLGEGVEDYTETRRFDAAPATAGTAPLSSSPATNPANWPVAQPQIPAWQPRQAKRGRHWLVWVIVGVVASSAIGGIFLGKSNGLAGLSASRKAEPPRSYVGVNRFRDADNDAGVTFDAITPPGSAADKAGLVGGDIIVSFDGQTVTDDKQLTKILTRTPIGKTVEVVYLRDGERKTTTLTTVSEEENDRLQEIFKRQPHGYLGVDGLDRVPVPGANLSGVRVGDVSGNGPAFIAGLQEGDIIVGLNGVPIRTEAELGMRIDRTPPLSVAEVVIMRGPQNGPLEKIEMKIKVGKD